MKVCGFKGFADLNFIVLVRTIEKRLEVPVLLRVVWRCQMYVEGNGKLVWSVVAFGEVRTKWRVVVSES